MSNIPHSIFGAELNLKSVDSKTLLKVTKLNDPPGDFVNFIFMSFHDLLYKILQRKYFTSVQPVSYSLCTKNAVLELKL